MADVVAEEAAKRLLPDLNLERKAKWAERVGVGVTKRLALVQADIWAKRSEAGDIYELDPLPLVTYFASIGIWMFDFPSTLLRIWIALQSSARGTVCLPGT